MRCGLSCGRAVILLAGCAGAGVGVEVEPTLIPVVTVGEAVSSEGRIVPVRYAVLAFGSAGELAELPVVAGSVVSEGDTLARLGKREAQEAALSQAGAEQLAAQQALDELERTADLARAQSEKTVVDGRAAFSEARHALRELDTRAFRDRLADKAVAVTRAEDTLESAREELEKHADLDPENATRARAQTAYDKAEDALEDAVYARDTLQAQLDGAQAAVEVARLSLADAERQLAARQNGADADRRALAEARLAAASSGAAAARRALDAMELTAPYRSTVMDVHGLEAGEDVAAGAPVVTVADLSTWMVETTDLTELDVVKLEAGQEVSVVPDALPEVTLAGVVESVALVPAERSGDVLYTVRVRLTQSDPRLRWGMTVMVTSAE